jgi:Fe-S cluster biosynthesis and repair protein YggX
MCVESTQSLAEVRSLWCGRKNMRVTRPIAQWGRAGPVNGVLIHKEDSMPRMVKCVKLQRELEGVKWKPFEDELGQRVYDNVSQEAWRMWLEHSKMLINEYRLDLMTPKAQQILREQMEQYFFGEGAALPPDYVPPKTK